MWQDWVNFVLGILLLVIAYSTASATWIAIVGVLVIIFSLWGALGTKKA
jgi:VanZ family protein